MSRIPRGKPRIDDLETNAILECIATSTLAMGAEIEKFEMAMAEMHNRSYALATSSGWSALFLVLKAVKKDLPDNCERAILPTTVCKSVLYAVEQAGYRPVLVDCNEDDFNINMQQVSEKMDDNTCVLVLPHLRGIPSDMADLYFLKIKYPGLYIIEDCAQSIGARYDNKLMGTWGDAAIFSFYPTKLMTSIDGGMVVTDNSTLYRRMLDMRYYQDDKYCESYNFKMNNINAAVGRVQLLRLDEFMKARETLYNMYRGNITENDLYGLVAGKWPQKKIVYDKYIVATDNKFDLNIKMKKVMQLIKTVHLLHRVLGIPDEDFPNAVRHHQNLFAFPIYPGLYDFDIRAMSEAYYNGN